MPSYKADVQAEVAVVLRWDVNTPILGSETAARDWLYKYAIGRVRLAFAGSNVKVRETDINVLIDIEETGKEVTLSSNESSIIVKALRDYQRAGSSEWQEGTLEYIDNLIERINC